MVDRLYSKVIVSKYPLGPCKDAYTPSERQVHLEDLAGIFVIAAIFTTVGFVTYLLSHNQEMMELCNIKKKETEGEDYHRL